MASRPYESKHVFLLSAKKKKRNHNIHIEIVFEAEKENLQQTELVPGRFDDDSAYVIVIAFVDWRYKSNDHICNASPPYVFFRGAVYRMQTLILGCNRRKKLVFPLYVFFYDFSMNL